MGRGNRNTSKVTLQPNKSRIDVRRDYPELDETPYLEKWYSLNDFVDYKYPAYVSVEPRPKHYDIEEDWKYRAVIHIGFWEEQRKYEKLAFYGDTPKEAIRKAAEDLGEIVFEPDLSNTKPKTIGLNPTVEANRYSDPNKNYALYNHYKDAPGYDTNHIRIKNVPKPKEVGEIKWYSQEFCDVRETGDPSEPYSSGRDESYSYTENGFEAPDSYERHAPSTYENIPTNFPKDSIPDEIFIVAKSCDTGDTYSSSRGKRERLFAFDTLEAAEEYASYRHPELKASYFDSGNMVILHSKKKGRSVQSESLYFDEY